MNEFETRPMKPDGGPAAETARIYGAVLGVGIVCSLAIVTVAEVTRPRIQRNRIQLRATAVLDVLAGATSSREFYWDEESTRFIGGAPGGEDSRLVFAGFDQEGALVGVAIQAQAMGYQDPIRLLYGYSPPRRAIVGIRILESRETPGLGDRIQSDPMFLRNFSELDVRLNAQGTQLANPIEFVKSGAKSQAWQIDGITGATISSRAVANMISESARHWIPLLELRGNDFTLSGEGD